jgi:hypothetical protein
MTAGRGALRAGFRAAGGVNRSGRRIVVAQGQRDVVRTTWKQACATTLATSSTPAALTPGSCPNPTVAVHAAPTTICPQP